MLKGMRERFKGFYFITSRKHCADVGLEKAVEEALLGGARIIQYREKVKERAGDEVMDEIMRIKGLCKEHDALFIINDYVERALKAGADGVHIGQEDLLNFGKTLDVKQLSKELAVGISVSKVCEALEAQALGAAYIGAGHIYKTKTKEKSYEAIGLKGLEKIREAVNIPIVAIGGISKESAGEVVGMGIEMLSAIGGAYEGSQIRKNVRDYTSYFA